jgi:hypothetical protein
MSDGDDIFQVIADIKPFARKAWDELNAAADCSYDCYSSKT